VSISLDGSGAGVGWPGFAFGWVVVLEGDLEVELDVPAGDAVLDDEAQQALAAVEVEVVEGGEYAFGEAGDAPAQPVLACEVGAAVGEVGVLGGGLVSPGGERRGAAGELVEVEQRGLVGVGQPAPLELGLLEFAFERGKLGADEVVVVGRCRPRCRTRGGCSRSAARGERPAAGG
jgi:hypothetical protein